LELRYRQVHLDFHTSEKIPGVGARFDKRQFQEMLKRGHVDSITLFSKCHHGLSYHDTKVGVRHPHLTCDLLPLQMDACREIDVLTPIYLSAGLDEAMIARHPEWGVKGRDGRTFEPLRPGFKGLCFNTPYMDYLCAQIEEAAEVFRGQTPGYFLDIISAKRCYCNWCLRGMQQRGLDPMNEADVDVYAQEVLQHYYERSTAACRKFEPAIRVFHNSGHIPKGAKQALKWNSHLELESLPTGGWGYDHFPISAKYAATTGYDFLGMTGKFHTTWGEFGGFKRENALRYEGAAILAFGSKCSVGDQLHPSGEMNPDTYSLIGAAYAEVAAKEPWCRGAKPVSEIALVSPEALRADRPGGAGEAALAEEGAARMLLEMHRQFDVIDLDHDLSSYRLVILPDEITLGDENAAFRDRLTAYLSGGGKLLLSGKSGMTLDATAFALPLGLNVIGRGISDPDYILPTEHTPTPPVRGPFVIHEGAWNVQPATDAGYLVMAHRADSYFNRTWDHFCSHQHTPDEKLNPYPALIANGSIAYLAHNLFTRYRQYGQPLYRDLVQDALTHLLGAPSVEVSLPTAGRTSLMRQEAEGRYVLHLLYAVPVKRGANRSEWASPLQMVEVIEDLVPLRDVTCAVRVSEPVAAVTLAPQGEPLPFALEDGVVRFTVPHLYCHQMVTLS
jgi:hypothetical protein